MKIKFYGYNAFVIKSGNKIIAIDPGADLYFFRLKSLISKNEWKDITLLARTHGQPASPTVLGKEIYVFYERIQSQIKLFKNIPVKLQEKFFGPFEVIEKIGPQAYKLQLPKD